MRLAASILAVVALSGGGAASLPGAANLVEEKQPSDKASPFAGLWTANLSKSKRDANHQFQRATLRFAVDGDSVTVTHGGINASGHEESGVTTLQADGEEHEVPEAPGMVVVSRWLGSRVFETVASRGGETAVRGVYEVSADGSTLTATITGTDPSGRDIHHVVVFDRE